MQYGFEKKKDLLGYFRKKKKTGEVEDIEFPGVLKEEHVEIPGVN